jgi:ABC-type nitrate/sulfonate/bicarbonate transport system substrate-binding protein
VTFTELAEELRYLAPLKLKWVGNTISGPQDIQTVVTGDIDVGGAFYGAILKLIAAKAPIKAVVGYYGSDANTYYGYYVKEDSPIKTARDLIGKKVAVNTLGAHLEFVLREYFARNGLSVTEAKQVTLVAIPPVSGEQALRQGQVEVSALSGVLRDKALERGGIRSLFNDTDLFGKFTGGAYVLREIFIKDNPNASRKLTEGISRAIEWAQTTPPEEVRARFDKIIAERKRNEDASSIKYWKSTGVAAKGGVISDGEIQVWTTGWRRMACSSRARSKPPTSTPMSSTTIVRARRRRSDDLDQDQLPASPQRVCRSRRGSRSGAPFHRAGGYHARRASRRVPGPCRPERLREVDAARSVGWLNGADQRPYPARRTADRRAGAGPRHRVSAIRAVSLAYRRPEYRIRT